MAGTLLHVTLADGLLAAAEDRRRLREAEANLHDYRLGSVFVDLPYFDRLWLNGLRAALDRPLAFDGWGTEIHRRAPTALALALLDRAATAADRAFALGNLTHMAVDLAFHPRIVREVTATTSDPRLRDTAHKRIEDALDHRCHQRLLGHPGIGTAYSARALAVFPSSGWTVLAREALIAVHGRAPGAAKLQGWLMNLRLFGVAGVSKMAPWVPAIPVDDPTADGLAASLVEDALTLCRKYVDAGLAYLEGGLDAAGFIALVPDRSLLDGEASLPGHPRSGA